MECCLPQFFQTEAHSQKEIWHQMDQIWPAAGVYWPQIEIKIGWENTTNFPPLYFLLINMVSSHCALKMPFCCHLKRKSGVQHQKPPKDICERFARERNFAHSTSSKFQHLALHLAP